jgi:hypothetical protein
MKNEDMQKLINLQDKAVLMATERIHELEKEIKELKQSRDDYKRKWEKARRRAERDETKR